MKKRQKSVKKGMKNYLLYLKIYWQNDFYLKKEGQRIKIMLRNIVFKALLTLS